MYINPKYCDERTFSEPIMVMMKILSAEKNACLTDIPDTNICIFLNIFPTVFIGALITKPVLAVQLS
jgi:hypothetical protein